MTNFLPFVARPNSRDKAMVWAIVAVVVAVTSHGALAQVPTSGPAELDRRVADRKLCETFERQYRIVVRTQDEATTQASVPAMGSPPGGGGLSLSPRRYLLLGGGVILVSLAAAVLSQLKKARA